MSFFKDKVVWITGASSGIGEALAMRLSALGARLILSARREHELLRVGKATGLPPLDLMILPFDLASDFKPSALAAQVINKFGRIDILINNGGFSQRSEALQTTEAMEKELMQVNYFAQVALAKAVLPYMIRQRNGQLIVISSIAGKFGFYLRSSYSAAKHALHGYFDSLRLETEKKGIKILIVCPGKIKTNISINALNAEGARHDKMDPSHEKAMSAEACSKMIISAILKEKKEIYPGGKEVLMVSIKRIFPALFEKLIRKQSAF